MPLNKVVGLVCGILAIGCALLIFIFWLNNSFEEILLAPFILAIGALCCFFSLRKEEENEP